MLVAHAGLPLSLHRFAFPLNGADTFALHCKVKTLSRHSHPHAATKAIELAAELVVLVCSGECTGTQNAVTLLASHLIQALHLAPIADLKPHYSMNTHGH